MMNDQTTGRDFQFYALFRKDTQYIYSMYVQYMRIFSVCVYIYRERWRWGRRRRRRHTAAATGIWLMCRNKREIRSSVAQRVENPSVSSEWLASFIYSVLLVYSVDLDDLLTSNLKRADDRMLDSHIVATTVVMWRAHVWSRRRRASSKGHFFCSYCAYCSYCSYCSLSIPPITILLALLLLLLNTILPSSIYYTELD